MFRTVVIVLSVTLAAAGSVGCRAASGEQAPVPGPIVARAKADQVESQTQGDVEPQGVITLAQAARAVLLGNPDLKAFPYQLRAAEARSLQAGLLPNPTIGVEVEEFAGSGSRSGFDAAETTVTLGQLIELGGKRQKRLRLVALESDLAELSYDSKRLDVLRDVTVAFFGVLAAQERLALTEQLRDLSQEAQEAVAQRVEAGKDSPVENLRADVAFSRSRIALNKAARALAVARQDLAGMWGARTPAFQSVTAEFYSVASMPIVSDVNEMLEANPDLARWAVRQQQGKAALDLEKAKSVVDVTVKGGVQRFQETDDSAFVIGLSVPIPVFDRNQAGVRQAVADLGRIGQEHKAAEIRTVTLLSGALSELASAHDERELLKAEVLPKAQQAFEAATEGYRQGKFDYLYVLDTQRTLFQTQVQFIDSIEAYHRARADVERLIGRSIEAVRDATEDVR